MPNVSDKNAQKRQESLEKAERQIKKGFLSPAVDIYAKMLRENPKDIDALLGMAIASYHLGNLEDTFGFSKKILEYDPTYSRAYTYIGLYYNLKGEHDKAIEQYFLSLQYEPDNFITWNFLHENYVNRNELKLFSEVVEKKLQENQQNACAWFYQGLLLAGKALHEEAIAAQEKALEIKPEFTEAWYNMGNSCYWLHRYEKAIECYNKVLKIAPKMLEARENLIICLIRQKKFTQAAALAPELIRHSDDPARPLRLLQNAYREANEFKRSLEIGQELLRRNKTTEAIASCMIDAQALKDNELTNRYYQMLLKWPCEELSHEECALLYHAARNFNDWPVAIKLWPTVEKALIESAKQGKSIHSLGKLNLISEPRASLELLKEAHIAIGKEYKAKVPVEWVADHTKAFSNHGRIRVGIVSGDFYSHVVSHFINGWVKFHDRSRIDLYCYANMPESRRDKITESYQKTAKKFIFVNAMPNWEIAKTIQEDGIHILLDLTGYTEGSLIEVMAYKPAPLIATWLGYPCTTGCYAVDYAIGDRWLYTPQHTELFVEKMLVLKESWYFVGEFTSLSPETLPPASKNGYITFGSLMNPYKINPDVIGVWTEIIRRVPDSRLMLNHPSLKKGQMPYQCLIEEFVRHGFPIDRLDITSERHPKDRNHLRYYHDFDIALDTFPQTGGTTTLESLIMAVPVITKVGPCLLNRISYSVINNSGLNDVSLLIAYSDEEYIQKAIDLANDVERLAEIRMELATSIKTSNLFSPRKMARQLEEGLFQAWEESFPDYPVNKLLEMNPDDKDQATKLKTVPISINGKHVNFMTIESEHDPYNYILQEQHQWFEPEYAFVFTLIGEGETFIDCCDDCGLYSLPIIQQVGKTGRVRACFRSSERKFFFDLCMPDKNNVENWMYESGLDVLEGFDRLDMIRISADFNDDEEGGIIGRQIDRLSELAPLIFFSAKHGNHFDLTMLSALKHAGFSIYHYLPTIDALVPFEYEGKHDAFLVNLFACKGGVEQKLADSGKLIRVSDELVYTPDFSETPFMDWLEDKDYAKNLIDDWAVTFDTTKDQSFEVFRAALDAWSVSQDKDISLPMRYAALKTAVNFIQPVIAAIHDGGVLLTGARILSDAGYRETSVLTLTELRGRFDEDVCPFDWPFLPPDASWDQTEMDNRLAEWIFAATLETLELRRAFSSFFTGQDQLESYQMIAAMGFDRQQVDRRIELIRQRYL